MGGGGCGWEEVDVEVEGCAWLEGKGVGWLVVGSGAPVGGWEEVEDMVDVGIWGEEGLGRLARGERAGEGAGWVWGVVCGAFGGGVRGRGDMNREREWRRTGVVGWNGMGEGLEGMNGEFALGGKWVLATRAGRERPLLLGVLGYPYG